MASARSHRWILGILLLATACNKNANSPQAGGGGAIPADVGIVQPIAGAKAANGWPLYEVKEDGFAIAAPPNWRHIAMNAKTWEKGVDELSKQDPGLAAMKDQLRQQVSQGIKFFAADRTPNADGFATNVNVMSVVLPMSAPLDAIVEATLQQFESMQTVRKPVAHERVTMKGGLEAEQFQVEMSMQTPGGKTAEIRILNYVIVDGDRLYTVTCTTLAGEKKKRAKVFEEICDSFRILKK